MSQDYPIVVMQDRYGGVYSGGAWLAIAEATDLADGAVTRAQFCLVGANGPSDSDVEAGSFWVNPPHWIAVGHTPDEAVNALRKSKSASEMRPSQRGFKVDRNTQE